MEIALLNPTHPLLQKKSKVNYFQNYLRAMLRADFLINTWSNNR